MNNLLISNKLIKSLAGILSVMLLVTSCEFGEDVDPDEDSDPRDNIVDTWRSTEISTIYGKSNFLVDISKEPLDSTKVILSNFYNLGVDTEVKGTLEGYKINIYVQVVNGNEISGEGNIAGDYSIINFVYKVDDGSGEEDNVSAEFKRI
ncbi:MAG: hypothetical protein IMY71_04735 [Bacteroidetes bacterium]|nr:hypothetical protein [Bacteroidota bacterium]